MGTIDNDIVLEIFRPLLPSPRFPILKLISQTAADHDHAIMSRYLVSSFKMKTLV